MSYKGPKGKAWKAFSDFIRLRDCLKTTGTREYCICVTCKKRTSYKNIQAGHAIRGRSNSILLHPDIVHGQCSGCNIMGEYAQYSLFMVATYGLEKWEEFVMLSKKIVQIKKYQWEEETLKYKEELQRLISQKEPR